MKYQVTTVVFHDDDINSDKFYRTFAGDNGTEIRQYGRIGALGAFQWFPRTSSTDAVNQADTQIRSKERKGYKGREIAQFDFPDHKAPTNIGDSRHLGQAFQASGLPGSRPHEMVDKMQGRTVLPSTPAQPVNDADPSPDYLLELVMEGINVSITDREAGTAALIDLRPRIDEAKNKLDQVASYLETLETLVLQ